jgi:predicted XRE-type DNA-binding protein
MQKRQLSIFTKEFKPMLYNIWNTQESIADALGVPQRTISDVVSLSEKRQLSIFAKEFKPKSIADALGVTQPTIANTVNSIKKRHLSIFYKEFKPMLYNIWNTAKKVR